MDKATFLEYLDKYMNGELLPFELSKFNNAMADNEEFKEAFDMQESIKRGIILFNRNKLKKKLERINTEINTNDTSNLPIETNVARIINNSKNNFTKYIIRIAAICIFVASIIAIRFNMHQEEMLFSGNVKFSNLMLDTIYIEQKNTQHDSVDNNLIQDFSNLDTNNKALSQNDFKNEITHLLFGASGNVFKNISVFYTKKEQHFAVSDTLIKVYLNHRNFKKVSKIELISKNALYIYIDSEVIKVFNR